jgi:hypothetical protein
MDDEEEEGFDLGAYGGDDEEEEEKPPARPARAPSHGDAGDDRGPGREDESDAEERRERPAPRARPARPHKKKSAMGPIVIGVVAVAALGGGGWFAWGFLQNRASAPVEEVIPVPELPAALEPTLEAAAVPAYQAAMDSLRSLGSGLPESRNGDWLSGRYLANASQFADVGAYWEDLEAVLSEVRQSEAEVFATSFGVRLDSLDVGRADSTTLADRANAGFRAAQPDRDVIYDRLQALIDASLDLHEFLLGNEDAIDYSPSAGGLSRDPVTEAVPVSEALGEEMLRRVSAITRALDELGALEAGLETQRLLAIVFGHLSRVPLRGPTSPSD